MSDAKDRCEKCGMSVTSMAETFANAIGRERARGDKLRAAIEEAIASPLRYRLSVLRAALRDDDATTPASERGDERGGTR